MKYACGLGIFKLGDIGIDGARIKANASKHKAMSGDYACKLEEQLKGEVAALLGASPITHVYTTGGGLPTPRTQIRSRLLQVPLLSAFHTEAAYGAVLLALQNCPEPTA